LTNSVVGGGDGIDARAVTETQMVENLNCIAGRNNDVLSETTVDADPNFLDPIAKGLLTPEAIPAVIAGHN
jgi:hypothetical protein